MSLPIISQDLEQLDIPLEGSNLDTWQDDLSLFLEQPINLNTASFDELISFPFFSNHQVEDIINYRKQYDGFVEVLELQILPSFSTEFVQKIRMYLTISNVSKNQQNDHHQLIVRHRWINQKEIMLDTSYSVMKRQDYWRYQANLGTCWRIGVLAENDPEEDFFKGSNSSVDYYNGFVQYQSDQILQKVLIGAYRLQLGQGLLFWNGWGLGKTNTTQTIEKKGASLQAYTSQNEINALQGTAIQLGKKNWQWTNFISYKNRDAKIENEEIQTLYQTGLHRIESEKKYKNQLRERIIGSTAQYKYRYLKLGATVANFHYQHPFALKEEVYNSSDFHGQSLWNTSLFYQYTRSNLSLFAEYVYQSNQGSFQRSAFLQGIKWKPSLGLTYVGLYRNYQRGFFSLYANAVGEASKPSNEQGIYQAVDWHLSSKILLHVSADFFEFPKPRYDVRFPSHGKEYLGQITYKYSSFLNGYIRYKQDQKQVSFQGQLIEQKRQQLRVGLNYQYYHWKFQSSLGLNLYQKEEREEGTLLGQTIQYRYSSKLKFTYRLIYYSTPSFQSAIYWYEHDVLYTFSLPAYYGQGFRQYLLVRYKLNNSLRAEAKFGYQEFLKTAEKRIRWEAHLQLIYTF